MQHDVRLRQRCGDLRQEFSGDVLMHQQFLGRIAHTHTLGFGVQHNRNGLDEVCGPVDIDMNVAGTSLNNRHLGIAHHGLDEPRTAAWHQHIDMATGLHHGGGSGTAILVDGLHQSRIKTVSFQHWGDNAQGGGIGTFGDMPTSQQRSITGLQAQAGHVNSDVGASFVNHADDAHGHARLGEAQSVRQVIATHDFTNRIGQRCHMAHALGCGGHARRIEKQAIELARVHAVFLGFKHVQRIGGLDIGGMLIQRIRNGQQQLVLGFGVRLGKALLCARGLIGLTAHRVEYLRTQFITHNIQA